MAESSKILAHAIVTKLLANTTIMGLVVDRVYTKVPQNATFPYIEASVQGSLDYSGNTFTGQEHTISVNCYSRENSLDEAGDMKAAVYDVLNRAEDSITLSSGRLATINYNGVGYLGLDEDSVTWLGISQFRAVVT